MSVTTTEEAEEPRRSRPESIGSRVSELCEDVEEGWNGIGIADRAIGSVENRIVSPAHTK